MTGSVFALMLRSLREDARRFSHVALRFGIAAMGYMLLCVSLVDYSTATAPGLAVFTTILWLCYTMVSLAALGIFPTAITEEKEEDTLGLLKMAGVSALALLLGKGVSRLISVLLMMISVVPLLFLTITLGGVTTTQLFAAVITLTAYAITLCSIGLFASVIYRRVANAAGFCLAVFLGHWFLPMMISETIQQFARGGLLSLQSTPWGLLYESMEYIRTSSTFSRLQLISGSGFSVSVDTGSESLWYCTQLLNAAVMSTIFSALAWALFERMTSNLTSSAPARWLPQFRKKQSSRNIAFSRVWNRALIWKEFYFLTGGWRRVYVKIFLYGLLWTSLTTLAYFVYISSSNVNVSEFSSEFFGVIGAATMMISVLIFTLEVSSLAGQCFQNEVQSNTLSLLYMLPRPFALTNFEKILGALISLIPIVFFFAMGWVIMAVCMPEAVNSLNSFFISDGFLNVLLFFMAFWHLVAYLSLVIRWGAFFAAIGITVAIQTILFIFSRLVGTLWFGIGTGDWMSQFMMATMFDLSLLGVIVFLQFAIGRKLRLLATQ